MPGGRGSSATPQLLRKAGHYLFRVLRDYRARRALQSMSDVMLQDIGLRRGDLGQIAPERFWQPVDWRGLDDLRQGRSH